jgi:hypothetical protein
MEQWIYKAILMKCQQNYLKWKNALILQLKMFSCAEETPVTFFSSIRRYMELFHTTVQLLPNI